MRRFDYVEPLVMLGTVVQWLVLATITGAVVGTGTSLFLYVLFILTDESIAVPFWLQLVLLPLGGLINGLLLYYGYRANTSGLKDSMLAAVYEQGGKMPFKTVLVKPVAAIVTLASGGSAGKDRKSTRLNSSH